MSFSPQRPVVIAVIDSGAIPYLPVFDVQDGVDVGAWIPVPVAKVDISRDGPPQERFDKDKEDLLRSLRTGTLYHYSGTRLLGYSTKSLGEFPTVDPNGHGTGTTYLAARDAPHAIIVSVQVAAVGCPNYDQCVDPSIADAMEWVADQSWIDIVSVSLINGQLNQPDNEALHEQAGRYLRASKRAADQGKIIVNGAGNAVVPSLADYFNGPPWIVNVGGFESNASGEAAIASKTVDVVANFSEIVPIGDAERYEPRSGTSLATPLVAATLAEALRLVRQTDPSRTPSAFELREALNATASYVEPTSWQPTPPPGWGLPVDPVRASLPVLIQPQMGWGYVDASMATEIARRVLEGDLAIPAGKEQAREFQPRWQQAREEYWSRYAS